MAIKTVLGTRTSCGILYNPPGHVPFENDCNDNSDVIHPGAASPAMKLMTIATVRLTKI